MAKSLNSCTFIGNLGKDPEIRHTSQGDAVASFSIACSESYKNKNNGEQVEKTEWINCVAWRKLAEIIGEYLHKGSKVWIEGKMQTRKWEDKNGHDRWTTEIIVSNMLMLDGKPKDQNAGNNASSAHQSRPESDNKPVANDEFDDEIPF